MVDCQFRSDEHHTALYVEGSVWAELSTENLTFSPNRDVQIPYTLSRFAQITYQQRSWRIRSPLAEGSVRIHESRLLSLIQDLEKVPELVDQPLAQALGVLLENAGLLNTQDDRYAAWPTEDLMYLNAEHTARHPLRALPPLKSPMSETIIPLPTIPQTHWQDQPLSQVLRERRTRYNYSETPISLEQLSEFLSRTLKVYGYLEGQHYDSTVRLYPSAGAAYELETYLLIEQCKGLAAGFYHYDPGDHALEQLIITQAVRQHWVETVRQSTNAQVQQPQILCLFTSRIGRIHWKFRSLALSYTNLGGLFQTLYLTATAMALAPCALGSWNASLFAHQTGIPLEEEALVGQFLLGNLTESRC